MVQWDHGTTSGTYSVSLEPLFSPVQEQQQKREEKSEDGKNTH